NCSTSASRPAFSEPCAHQVKTSTSEPPLSPPPPPEPPQAARPAAARPLPERRRKFLRRMMFSFEHETSAWGIRGSSSTVGSTRAWRTYRTEVPGRERSGTQLHNDVRSEEHTSELQSRF